MNMIKKVVKVFQFLVEYAHDLFRFFRFSHHSPFGPLKLRLFYQIVITAHTLEKGLSLKSPRPLFGKEKIASLLALIDKYPSGVNLFPIQMAVGAMLQYVAFNRSLGLGDAYVDMVESRANNIKGKFKCEARGGTKSIVGIYEKIADSQFTYSQFLESRFSCRAFDSRLLSSEEVDRLLKIARNAPSQCNRQSVRVHFYQKPEKVQELLTYQGGSKGFAEAISNLFVVTFQITGWGGPGQRNQGYVDAGLFSMSLMLGCHALGLASCPLNLAVSNRTEALIRRCGNIPQYESLVMMVAVGTVDGRLERAAMSPRLEVDQILIHED